MKKNFTLKIKSLMKTFTLQAFIVMMLCGLAVAHDHYGQILDQRVNLNLRDVSLETALKEIETVTHVKFFYSIDQLNVRETLSLEAVDRRLEDVLHQLLAPHRIRYQVHEREGAITLKREMDKPDQIDPRKKTGRLQVDLPPTALISGIVRDARTQQPMPGVNVLIKGTTTGTSTGDTGQFSIQAEDDDILVFSFIGYVTTEVALNSRTTVEVALEPDIRNLKEVVVNAGYWKVSDREQTGNISKVTGEEIARQPVTDPLTALQGKIPGVYIQENSGIPGASMNIQIRGQNSLRNSGIDNGNLPFFVVDGVPFSPETVASNYLSLQNGNPLISINPSDIESIEILKDADATAIYGSRGANGVVLITTKKGKPGKTRVTLDFSTGAGGVARRMDLLKTPEYIQMRREAFRNDNRNPGALDYDVNGSWDTLRNTDWQDVLIGGTARQTNASLTFSGGSESTQFLMSGNLFKQTYVFPGDAAFHRGSARIDLNHQSENKKLQVKLSSSFSNAANNLSLDYTFLALTLAPNAPSLYDSTGNLNWADNTWINPLAQLEPKYYNNTDNLIVNSSIGYSIMPGLTIRTTMGYTSTMVNEVRTSPLSQYSPAYQTGYGLTGSSIFANGSVKTWILEPQVEYKRQLAEGTLSFLAGSTFQQSVEERQTMDAVGYTSDALLRNIHAAADISIKDATYSQYRYNGVFGRLNYSLREKYIINLTARRDGSSRFGPGKQFANFAAAGAAWIFSNEEFMRNSSFLSFGKLRFSYGTTGNDRIQNYQYLNTWSSTLYPYNGTTGLVLTRLSNPEYSWETVIKLEAGLDLAFASDRITFSLSAYRNRATDQLVGRPLPLITGQPSVQFNLPAIVENRGLEFLLSTTNVTGNHFRWTTGINLTLPQNELIEFPDLEFYPAYANILEIGKSIQMRKTYASEGVDPETGAYAFTDFNNDGAITSADDRKQITETAQKYFGGIHNSFAYKGFQLDIQLQFVHQKGLGYPVFFQRPGRMSNQPDVVLARWRESGDITDIQRYSTAFSAAQTAYTNYTMSDRAYVDASFLRIRNVYLSWKFPERWSQKTRVSQARIFAQGQNLFTWSDYIGLSPENKNARTLPPLRMATIGIQITL